MLHIIVLFAYRTQWGTM